MVRAGIAALTAAAALAVGACGASGEKVIAKEDLERAVSDRLTEQGHDHDAVTCAEDLQADIAFATRCEMTVGGARYRVTVVVTSLDGDRANYDIDVDSDPIS